MEVKDLHCIGYFNIEKGIIITDPCYSFNTVCQQIYPEAKKGQWMALIFKKRVPGFLTHKEIRNATLYIIHSDYASLDNNLWKKNGTIGVDSGQAGFYDIDWYRENFRRHCSEEVSWFEKVNIINYKDEFRLINNVGITAVTGYGDGEYPVEYAKNSSGEIFAFKITFIDNRKEDEDE